MPNIDETESGLFPTPTADSATDRSGNYKQGGKPLTVAAKESLLPTPSARDWKDTPGMAAQGINPDGSTRNRTDQLARVVYFTTPTARDANTLAKVTRGSGSQGTENDTGTPLPVQVGGTLNPQFVEYLMGYPIGHTVCEGWETQSSRKSPRRSSARSSKSTTAKSNE